MAKKGRRATEEERVRAVRLMEDGKYSPEVVADILGVSRSSVFDWQRRYRADGLAALSTKFASGRPTMLSDKQMMRLWALIVGRDPRQYSFGPALWTREMIGELIRRQFGVSLSLVTVGRILKKLGLSAQRPLYRAYQQDPVRVERWKREGYPKIRALARAEGASIFFGDEASVRTDHHAGTTWAPVGVTPVVTATGERRSVQMVSAVSAQGALHFDVFQGRMNSDRFIEFLAKLLDSIPGKIFLILDGASYHHSRKVHNYVTSTEGRLRIFQLPPYSPELNPDEWVWNNTKNHGVAKAVAMSQAHLHTLVVTALKRLQNTPDIVRGFFADPHLAYIHE